MDDGTEDKELRALNIRLEAVRKDIFHELFYTETIRANKEFIKTHDRSISSTLQYAEVDAESFLTLIQSLKDFDIGFTEDAVFIDVGCGPGKTLVIMAIMNVFQRAIGVDINPFMTKLTGEVIKKYNRSWRSPVDLTEMEVVTGDGTFYDWSIAQLVYIQATCFNEDMMQRITTMADKMKPSSILILVNNRLLRETSFDLMGIVPIEYSFGKATALIYKKQSMGTYEDVGTVQMKMREVLEREFPVLYNLIEFHIF